MTCNLVMMWQSVRGGYNQYIYLKCYTSNIRINADYMVCGWCDSNVYYIYHGFIIKYPMKQYTLLVFYLVPFSSCHVSPPRNVRRAADMRCGRRRGSTWCGSVVSGLQTVTATPRGHATWLTHKSQDWEVMKGLPNCFTTTVWRRRLSLWFQSISL